MPTILVLHGPNLNLLGRREPAHYGSATLAEIDGQLREQAAAAGVDLVIEQSNAEHRLVEIIQQATTGIDFIVINPAAFTHTSVAIRDALAAVAIPYIEVHLSNVFAREPFRHHSYLSDLAVGVISGLGPSGYRMALAAAIERVTRTEG